MKFRLSAQCQLVPQAARQGRRGQAQTPAGASMGGCSPWREVSAFFSLTVHSAQMFVTPLKIHVLHAYALSFFSFKQTDHGTPKGELQNAVYKQVGSWCPKNSSLTDSGSNFHPFELNVFCNS